MLKFNTFRIFLLASLGLLPGCAPYSLPEPKVYSNKEAALTVYMQSQDLYQADEYVQALQLIDSALAINQNFAQFYQLKGDILRKLARYDSALVSYLAAISQRSNYTEVYISIAEIYHQQNHFHESVRYYRKALAVDTTLTPLYLEIVNNYISLQEWEVGLNMLDDYSRLLQSRGQQVNPDYYYLKGKILFNQKYYTQAVQELLQYRPETASHQAVLALLGRSYYNLANYESGIPYFNKLVRMDAKKGEWYYYRGIYYFQKNNLADARNQFDTALSSDSTMYNCHYYLGKIYELQGEVTRAVEEFRLYRESMRSMPSLGSEGDELRELKSYTEDQ
jgi:tetratricopeptide (TPR) repeat protein